LRALTRQAKQMADHRLPEAVADILGTPLGEDVGVPTVTPVRVKTRDDVADVAEALNTVQDSALDLAVEQAVLRRNIADSFVNLGRRNQNLLGDSSTSSPSSRRARPSRGPWPTCSASTTSPPAGAATPSRCSCSRALSRPASGRPRSG
jgi:hypothetical protein